MPGKKTRTRTRSRRGQRTVRKTRRQRQNKRKTLRQHKRRHQRGGSFIEDSRRIPDDAIYTGYNPDVEGMFSTEVYSDIKKARADDSMDIVSPMGV